MEHQKTNHWTLPVSLSVVNHDIRIITLSLLSNVLLAGLSLAERRAPTSKFLTADEMQTVNSMITDVITLLAMLIAKFLHRNDIDFCKVAVLEDVARLFVATSRIGLGLHMVCECLMGIKFQQSRESSRISSLWISIIKIFVKENMYRKGKYAVKAVTMKANQSLE